jgi:hypothetical protein
MPQITSRLIKPTQNIKTITYDIPDNLTLQEVQEKVKTKLTCAYLEVLRNSYDDKELEKAFEHMKKEG